MEKNVVFFLGAGFSAPFGFPTAKDFAEKTGLHRKVPLKSRAGVYLPPEAMQGLRSAWYLVSPKGKNEAELDFETVFSILDITAWLNPNHHMRDPKKFVDLVEQDLGNILTSSGVRRSFVKALWHIYAHQLDETTSDDFEKYKSFFASLAHKTLGIVTLNYDVVAESVLAAAGYKPVQVQLFSRPYATGPKVIPIYKLHGSVNWCLMDGYPQMLPLDSFRQVLLSGTGPAWEPLLVPPTWRKGSDEYSKHVLGTWRAAATAIAQADTVVYIGFSMSQTDIYLLYFLRTALSGVYGERKKRKYILVNTNRGHNYRIERKLYDFVRKRGLCITEKAKVYQRPFLETIKDGELLRILKNN